MSNTEIKKPVLSLNVVGPSDDNNEFIVGTMVDGSDQYPAIQFGGTTLEVQNGELHISGDLVVDGDVYTDGSDEPVGPGGGGTHVAANSGGVTTDTLRTLQVGDVNYSVPERVIIVPNEDGVVPAETLETLQIGETVYGIPSGGGSDILDSDNVFTGENTFEQGIKTPGVGNFVETEDHRFLADSGISFEANYDIEDPSSSYASFDLESVLYASPEDMEDSDKGAYVNSTVNNDMARVYMGSNAGNSSAGIEVESYGGEYATDASISMSMHVEVPQDEDEPLQCYGGMGLYAEPIMEDDTLVGVKSGAVIEANVININADEVLVNGGPIGGSNKVEINDQSSGWYIPNNVNMGFLFARSAGSTPGIYYFAEGNLHDLVISIINAYNEGKDIWLTGEAPAELWSPNYQDRVPVSFRVTGVMNPQDNTGVDDSYVTVFITAPVIDESDPDNIEVKIESKMITFSDHRNA